MFELALNCRTCFLRMLGLRFACFASLFEDVVTMMSEVMSTYIQPGWPAFKMRRLLACSMPCPPHHFVRLQEVSEVMCVDASLLGTACADSPADSFQLRHSLRRMW